MKIDEIAQMYDCSSNTIKSRLNYAKKFVREKVETREKQDNVRLHSVGGVSIFFLGIHQLLTLPKYTVSQAISGQILSTAYEFLKIDKKNLASKKFSAKSFSAAKTALIVGSATVGTLTIVATSVAAYNHVSPSKADIISTPAAVVIASEAQITFEVPEVPEATEVTETTEVTEATETTETTETPEATEAPKKTKKEEASEDSKKSDSKDTSDKKKKPKEENTSSDNPLEGSSISIDATAE